MKKNLLLISWLCFTHNLLFAQETFNMMFYNVLDYPNLGPASRIDNLDYILQDYQPDMFMICELNEEVGADNILARLQGIKADFSRAVYVNNTSDDLSGDSNLLQNMVFYDSSKFILTQQDEITTIFRDFNYYRFLLNTVNQGSNPIFLNVFVCHLKAGSGTDDQADRLQMVNDLMSYLDSLPSDELVMLAGDLNLYTDNEAAYQELTDVTNNIYFTDPVNRVGTWHTNLSFLDVFTQSTRTQAGMGGATGGFDDRFDFILTSPNLLTDPDLSYVVDSYKAYGNNGNTNCYNQAINSSDCSGPDFDQVLRENLFMFSDHLPVTMQFSTNEALLGTQEFEIEENFRILGSNIVNDQLNLEFGQRMNFAEKLVIYNTVGQRMLSADVANLNQISLDVSNWSKGVYYIQIYGNTQGSLKFIKN